MIRLWTISLLLILASCATQEELSYTNECGHNFSYHGKKSIVKIQDLPADAAYYKDLLDKGYDASCAEVVAYSLNDVVLERKLSGCHKLYIKFQYVESYIEEDTLYIAFTTHRPGNDRPSTMMLHIKTYGEDFDATLYHGHSMTRKVYYNDGTFVVEKTPSSTVTKKKLALSTISKDNYEEVIGEIDIEAHFSNTQLEKTQERIFGSFRTRIAPNIEHCPELICSR